MSAHVITAARFRREAERYFKHMTVYSIESEPEIIELGCDARGRMHHTNGPYLLVTLRGIVPVSRMTRRKKR
jgi:hypothetical protein